MSQSLRLKDYMKNIGIDKSLRNSANFEHRFLQNITKLYKHAGKCEDQHQSKDIFEDAIISTPEIFTNNNPISLMTPTTVKKPSARKSLCLFTNILDVKKKADIWWVGAAKSKRKESIAGTTPWALKPKRKGNSRINDNIKKTFYNWIINNPQVLQSPIFNDCLKVNIDGHTRPQIVPIFNLRCLY